MTTLANINILDILPLIDKKWLFTGLWKLKGEKEKGEEIFKRMTGKIAGYDFEPKLAYEIFSSKYDKKTLKLFSKDGKEVASFEFVDKYLKLAGRSGVPAAITRGIAARRRLLPPEGRSVLLCATIGGKIKDVGQGMFKTGEYTDYFYLNGLAASLTEALTEYGHLRICEELGLRREETFRISPGYPAWPEISDQAKISKLVSMDKIGVSVSETFQLVPEFSTTAMIFG